MAERLCPPPQPRHPKEPLMKQRNHVALALSRRGGGTKAHKKTRKAMRRSESMKLKKEI
jgi:hypothetical protein